MRCMLLLAAAVLAQGAWAGESFPLAGAPVVCEDGFFTQPRRVRGLLAARDMTNALRKVTGCASALYRESEAPPGLTGAIYLGDTAAAKAAGLDAASLRRGAFRIKVEPRRAFVLANTGMAASFGAIEFLQRFADYWFVTIDGDDPWQENPAAAAPVTDVTLAHALYARHVSLYGSRYPRTSERVLNRAYSRRMRLSRGSEVVSFEGTTAAAREAYRKACRDVMPELERAEIPSSRAGRTCHTFFRYCSPEKYFKDHPE